MKFRPIVGGPNSSSQRLSHLLDIILKPLCPEVPSFVRDDIDFLNHLPKTVDRGSILATFDVVSLYTNIPHDVGEDAVRYWLAKYKGKVDFRFNETFIIEGLKIVLKRNVFYFNGKRYKQNTGTGMGAKVAPTFATLFMGYLEESLYDGLKQEHGTEVAEYVRKNWKRFLDDCFITWNLNLHIESLHDVLNSLHPKIRFTMDTSREEISFLDVLIKLKGESVSTDIYFKPTDTHSYLNFKSCHPKHTKTNIPFCLASRIVTIVSENEQQKKRLAELREFLKKQDYPESLIDIGIQMAILKGPITGASTRKTDDRVIPFVSTFNPNNSNVMPFVRDCETLLNKSARGEADFKQSFHLE